MGSLNDTMNAAISALKRNRDTALQGPKLMQALKAVENVTVFQPDNQNALVDSGMSALMSRGSKRLHTNA